MTKKIRIPPRRRLAYQRTFCGEGTTVHLEAEHVLADLRRVARIDEGGLVVSPTTRTTDSHATMYQLGMRDLYARICLHLGIEESQQFEQAKETHDESAQT